MKKPSALRNHAQVSPVHACHRLIKEDEREGATYLLPQLEQVVEAVDSPAARLTSWLDNPNIVRPIDVPLSYALP
jgi:hypothetical protein